MSMNKTSSGRFSKHSTALVAVIIAALVAACSPPGSNSADSVRLQSYAGGSMYLGYLTQALGNFDKEGVDVSIVEVSTGPQALNAMLSGSLDIGILNTFTVQPLLAQRQKLQVIGGHKGPYPQIIGSASLTETQWPQAVRQLKGRTIGVLALGGGEQAFCEIALRGAGLQPSDYTFVGTGSSQATGAALSTGRVDAGCVSDVPAASLISEGRPVLFSFLDRTSPASQYPADILSIGEDFSYIQMWSTTDWAAKNPESVDKVRRGMAKTVAWMNDPANFEELVSILEKSPFHVESFSDETFRKFVKDSIPLYSVMFTEQSRDTWMKLMPEAGFGTMPDADVWVAPTAPVSQADIDRLVGA